MIGFLVCVGIIIALMILGSNAIEAWMSPNMEKQTPKHNKPKSKRANKICVLCGESRTHTVKSDIGPICTECLEQHGVNLTD